jgi:hypothetical protein
MMFIRYGIAIRFVATLVDQKKSRVDEKKINHLPRQLDLSLTQTNRKKETFLFGVLLGYGARR